jgi:aspartyl-tRNA(Asn)/glutamyl-tRNA(Gln) amidotransferase subunit A
MQKTIKSLQQQLLNKELTCRSVVENFLSNIESKKQLNAYVEVFRETALQQADLIDKKIADNQPLGKLFGCVMGIKDNISYKNHKVSGGSKILEGYTAPYNATVIQNLLQEDAVIIGRLNCDEFAMGSSNETSFHGIVKNPVDETRVPGGSSGGSAAAVKANLCHVSLGSDTGGSIRQPASLCGVVGVKPTYGRVSRYGLLAYGSSFDQIGPFANNVEDAALVLEVIAGKDEYDATVSSLPVPQYSSELKSGKKEYKIGYYEAASQHESIDSDVRNAMKETIKLLEENGCIVEPVSFEEIDYVVPAYYVLTTAEASSNLSRYDGIRYGFRDDNAYDLETTYRLSRSNGFGKEVKRRIMSGTFVLSSGYYEAYYSKAQKVRRIISDKTKTLLNQYDFLLCPTAPSPAFKIGDKTSDPIAMYLADIFTVQANMVGIPAVSLPLATSSDGLPIGVQFMANKFEELKLLQFSELIMKKIS